MRELAYLVPEADDGRQIKRVVRALGISNHQFKRMKAHNALLLDGLPVHANHIVHTGQTVLVRMEDDAPCAVKPDAQAVSVVFEDTDLLVIDKSAPLACQSSPRQTDNTLENRLTYRYGAQFVFRPVNRLDKGTSGLMVAAKNPHIQMLLSRALHTPDFLREYLAIVVGEVRGAGVIDAPIRKKDGPTIRREVGTGGRESRTYYEALEYKNGLTLMRLRLDTGRTHQIRVHMEHIGHSVLGDFLYGTEDARLPGRFALHSCHAAFTHPMTGERVDIVSPLPDELARLLDG